MTTLRRFPRHWTPLVAAALVLAALVVAVKNPDRVYWAKTEVVFLYPGLAPVSTTFVRGTDALVNFAELVRLKVAERDQEGETVAAMSGGTLSGAGFRRGVSVILPNMGGQWTKSYSEPRLSVEVVDTDPGRVRASMLIVLGAISSAARDLQIQVSTPRDAMVTVTTIPQSIEVVPEGPSLIMVVRGFAAALAVLLLLVPFASKRRLSGLNGQDALSRGSGPG
ncbi:hypothetical protein [Sinomonas sp. RB5]